MSASPPSPDRPTARALLGWAVEAGLLAAAAEAVALVVRKWGLGVAIEVGALALWMTPLANLLLALSGLAIGLGVRVLRPDAITSGRAAGAGAALAVLAFALHWPQLHPAAAVVLAAGVAHRVSRGRRTPPGRWRLLPLIALAGLAPTAALAQATWTERSALAALPAAPAGSPDVLLIVLDTVRVDSTSLGGAPRPTTPWLETWSARGTRFEQAYSTAPWTLPSHAGLFTGRYPRELSATWTTPLDGTHPVLAEVLARRGYRTGGFVANLLYCTREFGLDRGFSHYADYAISPGELAFNSSIARAVASSIWLRALTGDRKPLGYKSCRDVNGEFLSWLDAGDDRPYFAFLNYMDAHEPYFPPAPFDRRSGARPQRLDSWQFHKRGAHRVDESRIPAEELAAQVAGYEGGIALMDQAISELLAALEQRGRLANTLVIVTSDHGEQFGEHGDYGHGESVYREETHVPLVFVGPGVPAGRRDARPASLVDLAATVLERVGAQAELPGRSLLAGGPISPVVSELGTFAPGVVAPPPKKERVGLVSGRHRVIVSGDGTAELYDLSKDPGERRNLALTPAGLRALPALRAELSRAAIGAR